MQMESVTMTLAIAIKSGQPKENKCKNVNATITFSVTVNVRRIIGDGVIMSHLKIWIICQTGTYYRLQKIKELNFGLEFNCMNTIPNFIKIEQPFSRSFSS